MIKTKLFFTKKKDKKNFATQISKTQARNCYIHKNQKASRWPTEANYTIERNPTQEPGNTTNTSNFDMNFMQEGIKVSTEFKRTSINTLYNHLRPKVIRFIQILPNIK